MNTESNSRNAPQDGVVRPDVEPSRHPRGLMRVILPALLVTYVALPLAVAHK